MVTKRIQVFFCELDDLYIKMNTRKILTIIGARPQFIKASAVSASIAGSGRLTEVVAHTGQHFAPTRVMQP